MYFTKIVKYIDEQRLDLQDRKLSERKETTDILRNNVSQVTNRNPSFVCCSTGCHQGRQELIGYTKFAEFTLTKEDAVRYLYADSAKHRVHRWKDIKVSLYI